jgi:hypothetical protein
MKFVLLIIFFPLTSYAGRPVYRELSTTDLIEKATWAVAVKNLRVKKIKLECGWDSELFNVEVVTVLKPRGNSTFKPGQEIEFNPHPTAALDCELRTANPSGASFSAEKYKSSLDVGKLKPNEMFVIFLAKNSGGLVLVADNAIEAHEKMSGLFEQASEQTADLQKSNKAKMIAVGPDWQGTINEFCAKNLKGSTPLGGTRCDRVRVSFDKTYGTHSLKPCQSTPTPAAVQWKAIACQSAMDRGL